MRWTTAWLLALAAHVAVVALVWLGCRNMAPRPATEDVVELAVLEAPQIAPQRLHLESRRSPLAEKPTTPRREPKHEHEHEHGYGHGHELAHEELEANASAPVNVAPPVRDPVRAPIDLNLGRDSLAALTLQPQSGDTNHPATTDTATLHGTIASDGSMHLRNKSPVTVGSDLTSPGGVLKDWLKDPKAHAAERDGTVALLKGTFDATDSIMRAAGQDPYRAQRMKMLDETREQRLTLAARDRTTRRESELLSLPRQLRNIWNDAVRPARERRQTIFQLWDECQESDEGEAEGSAAGARARREIVLFIRERLGEDSRDAYPKEEITALNLARQSRQRFDPYGRSPL